MKERKEILSYVLEHKEGKRNFFKWNFGMIWCLMKYKVWYNMDITFTCTKYTSEDKYLVQFFAE